MAGWVTGSCILQRGRFCHPLLVPRCFGASSSATTGDWYLLLEDLTDSHTIATAWPLPPTKEQCERIVGAWARFHAAWWDDPRLGHSIGSWSDQPGYSRTQQEFASRFTRFADRFGETLPLERRMLYEQFIDATPRLLRRYGAGRDLTLIHGDSHVWNVFMPRDGGDDIRLFDWDAWRIGIGASDLAYMMALHWYPDRRYRLESALLDRYHGALLDSGVTGCDRRTLDDDYRWAVLSLIMAPVWQATADIPPVIWWNHMERIMLAVEDLGCRDLLA